MKHLVYLGLAALLTACTTDEQYPNAQSEADHGSEYAERDYARASAYDRTRSREASGFVNAIGPSRHGQTRTTADSASTYYAQERSYRSDAPSYQDSRSRAESEGWEYVGDDAQGAPAPVEEPAPAPSGDESASSDQPEWEYADGQGDSPATEGNVTEIDMGPQ
ncbi:MAG: hypothetical protein ACQKBV_07620 [Puniceicoccales bacterium]